MCEAQRASWFLPSLFPAKARPLLLQLHCVPQSCAPQASWSGVFICFSHHYLLPCIGAVELQMCTPHLDFLLGYHGLKSGGQAWRGSSSTLGASFLPIFSHILLSQRNVMKSLAPIKGFVPWRFQVWFCMADRMWLAPYVCQSFWWGGKHWGLVKRRLASYQIS